MKMRTLTPVLLAGAMLLCVGTEAQAQKRQLTEAEIQTAYRATVRYISTEILGSQITKTILAFQWMICEMSTTAR
jgi:hypothetical protein